MTVSAYPLSSEKHLAPKTLNEFWQQRGQFGSFAGVDDIMIRYACFVAPQHHASIVISSGRIEAQLKYQELVFDLFQCGYSVFILDHRGQGTSGRLCDNSEIGHVEHFDHYVEDLHRFYTKIVDPLAHGARYLLCHSMGAAIGAHYLARYPEHFQAAAFSAPMFGIHTHGIPYPIVRFLARSMLFINRTLDKQPWYFPGQHDYQPPDFADNELTHSQPRYTWFREIYEQHPTLKLGGVSTAWLVAAMRCVKQLKKALKRVQPPVLVLQASEETVVSNRRQNRMFRRLKKASPQSQMTIVEGAKHEILIEKDAIRNPAITNILNFFSAFPGPQRMPDPDE